LIENLSILAITQANTRRGLAKKEDQTLVFQKILKEMKFAPFQSSSIVKYLPHFSKEKLINNEEIFSTFTNHLKNNCSVQNFDDFQEIIGFL
jgi:hypothetical protein